MKARITIRQSKVANCYTLLNGKTFAVVHANDIKDGLIQRVEKLKSYNCDFSADQLLKCIRLN